MSYTLLYVVNKEEMEERLNQCKSATCHDFYSSSLMSSRADLSVNISEIYPEIKKIVVQCAHSILREFIPNTEKQDDTIIIKDKKSFNELVSKYEKKLQSTTAFHLVDASNYELDMLRNQIQWYRSIESAEIDWNKEVVLYTYFS